MIGSIIAAPNYVRYSAAAVNIIFDGNSFVAGFGASGPSQFLPAQMATLAPLSGNVPVINTGVSGQTIANMRTRGSAFVDANYVAGKKNVLLALEGYNTIVNTGVTGAQAGAQMAAYCADRLVAHPDFLIALVSTIGTTSAGNTSVAALNAELLAYDNYLRNNFKAMGAKIFIDLRADGVFAYTGPTFSEQQAPLMYDPIHPNDAGYGPPYIAQYCANGLKRMPVR